MINLKEKDHVDPIVIMFGAKQKSACGAILLFHSIFYNSTHDAPS